MSDCSKCFDKCLECKRREEAYQQGRADAINECFAKMKEHSNPLWHDWLDKLAERVKERSHE